MKRNHCSRRRRSLLPLAAFTAAALIGAVSSPLAARAARTTMVAPNLLTAKQAETELATDNDSFWRAAETASQRLGVKTFGPVKPAAILARGTRAADTHREIALTFDDGPHPGYTPELLGVLKKYEVPATFFVVGEMAEKAPDLVRQELADGDEVGNHTYHHVSLVKITPREAEAEIEACDLVLRRITGQTPHLFRPPGGRYDPAIADAATSLGYTTVLWTDDPADFASPGVPTIIERTERTAHPGGILLLHDGVEQTITALPSIITDLRREGYTFVTVDKMLEDSKAHGVHTETGEAVTAGAAHHALTIGARTMGTGHARREM